MPLIFSNRGGGQFGSGSGSSGGGTGAITHGDQLTIDSVGPWALQGVAKGYETLQSQSTAGTRVSTYPGWGRPAWIPGSTYVYDNDTSNHGGVVGGGGITIDGYAIPAGVWVSQFMNFTDGVVIEGDASGAGTSWPGIVFRGCRMRGKYGAPGWFNENGQALNGKIWIIYADAGGDTLSATPSDMCESIFESKGNGPSDKFYVIRSYLSRATTLVFLRNSGDAAIENYCREVTDFGDNTKHLNGIGNSGNQTATMWLRNNMILSVQSGSTQLTDVIQFAADDGPYLGAGTNIDSSAGYQIRDNLLAGAAYTLQLGVDKANTAADVRNITCTGNKFSTQLYEHSGSTGLGYKGPTWGSFGNVFSGNTWADDYGTGSGGSGRQYPAGNGPRSGADVSSSEIAAGP